MAGSLHSMLVLLWIDVADLVASQADWDHFLKRGGHAQALA